MEKKRARVITGWRQVTRPRSGLSKRPFVPPASSKDPPEPRVAVADKAANERWETEGGNFVEPLKVVGTKP